MAAKDHRITAKLTRPKVFIPALLLLGMLAAGAGYWILLSPNSVLIRWALAALPSQITMISFGPYPDEAEFQRLQKHRVKYVVSLLDPRLPYEKQLIDREQELALKYHLTVKVFPMASIFDRQIFSDYAEQQQKAVEFLKNLDGPAYVHCYLGKHRVSHVRDELAKAGVPRRYWTASTSGQEDYWELVNRLDAAQKEYDARDYAKVIQILAPLMTKDADVTNLRGWAHYRLGLIDEAAEDFRQGLELDPANPRNLIGSGFCYLRQDKPVLAQRQFGVVLEQYPEEPSALTGLGLAYIRLGDSAAAAGIFRRILAKNPENTEAREYLRQTTAP
jgi:tetratricopeptide (TPR) repeat protein